MRYTMVQNIKRAVCLIRGHSYNTPEFRGNSLYFCSRCGREMFGRTFADIEPMSDDEIEMMHRFDHARE
ncbi:MAG TPA: hypothetical protein VJ577_11330 [Burkholderiaceae bacterium]|nr:hypothetical protein [Burkholderiaceae bacterium]